MPEFARIDESLVARACEGEHAAVETLAARARPLVYRWALVQLGDADGAEDVAQSVLITLTSQLGGFRGEARFTTWLYQVTRNVVLDVGRRRTRRKAKLAHHAPRDAPEATDVTEAQHRAIDTARLAQFVRRAFDALPERQREILDLVDLQGYPATEAAKMVGIEASTARVHLLRARRAIRDHILATHPALVEDRA